MSSTDNKIHLLSNKIGAYVDSRRNFPNYIDTKITGEDLQYNLTPILTDLLLMLLPVPVNYDQIEEIINDYNMRHGSILSLAHFMKIGWLRLINEEYIIPLTILRHMWRLDDPNNYKNTQTPIEFEQDIKCLHEIHNILKRTSKTSIDLTSLDNVIKRHSQSLDTTFFIDSQILSKTTNDHFYYSQNGNYIDHLKDRIISLAWFKITEKSCTILEFRQFLRFITFINSWPNKIEDYLPDESIQKIRELSEQLLRTEPDLLNPEVEVRNDKLDAEYFRDSIFNLEVADYIFGDHQLYDFFQQLEHFRIYDHNLLRHQSSRSVYLLLIRFVLQFEFNQESPYHLAKKLMKDHKNPFIKWQMMVMIKETFPKSLPYFIHDQELAPLFFQVLDKLNINDQWLIKNNGYQSTLPIIDGIRNDLWMEAFNIYLDMASHCEQPEEFGKGFAAILCYLAKKVFTFNSNNYYHSTELHKQYNLRYSYVVTALGTTRMALKNHYPRPLLSPLLLTYILPEMFSAMQKLIIFPARNEFLELKTAKFDVYIELLRFTNIDFGDLESYSIVTPDLSTLSDKITKTLYTNLLEYLTRTDLLVHHYYTVPENIKVKRSVNEFGHEILDLALVFLHFQKKGLLNSLDNEFKASLDFNLNPDKHYEHDREEAHKVAIYLKLLLIAYISLSKRQNSRELNSYPVTDTLRKLESMISDYALAYNSDVYEKGKHDVFSSIKNYFRDDMYTQSLVSMLYLALNSFPIDQAKIFIDQYFNKNEDLSKLFIAVNRIDDKDIKSILTKKIEEIDPKVFINTAFTVTELESALIEIVNSRTLYHFAAPFLKTIEDHAAKRKIETPEKTLFLYKIKLLLALKQKQTKVIQTMEVPKNPYSQDKINNLEKDRKQFYLALDQFYNYKNYGQAIKAFLSLHAAHPKNVEYAFHLYQSSAFQDLENNIASDAKNKWDNFKTSLKDEEKSSLNSFYDLSNSIDLIYFSWEHDDIKFDLTIHTLPPVYLYQEQLVICIYENYVRRGMHDVGYAYLNNAISYLKDNGEEINEAIEELKDNAVDDLLIEKVRNTLSDLRNLPAKHIPKVLPKILNDKRKLDEFILAEIIGGMKVMRKKIRAVESIINEDHFNDVFLATLRLRFPVFGWEITDQERTGSSTSGKDAGEADIVIKSGGHDLALVEALKMNKKDFNNLEKHILKCGDYSRDLGSYYIVVYYHGEREKFEDFIEIYKKDIATVNYTSKWAFNNTDSFVDLNEAFDNTENMYIGKTLHGSKKLQLFHIIVDLSKKLVEKKLKKF